MATTTDEGFHEIQLNGKQLVFLFMAVTVVSVVIFLLGVMVGRGVQTTRGPEDPLGDAAPVAAAADLAPPALAPGGGPPAAAGEELSYPQRLGTSPPPAERLRDSTPPPVAAAAPKPAPAPAQSASNPPSSTPPAASAGEPAGSGFAIQLTALANREEADSIVKRLNAKGYSAYVMSPAAGAPTVFRVRVGKFKDRREAEAVAERLQKEEQFNPWIVR